MGATNQVCVEKTLFESLKPLAHKVLIHLPDGKVKSVQFHGDIHLHRNLTMHNALYILTFKHNLLLVAMLCRNGILKFSLYPSFCVLQDLRTKRIIVVGKLKEQLYILDTKSFSPETIKNASALISSTDFVGRCMVNNVNSISIWHKRLGQPFEIVMQHLPFYSNKDRKLSHCDVCQITKQTKLSFL